jgi:hypothetical protein
MSSRREITPPTHQHKLLNIHSIAQFATMSAPRPNTLGVTQAPAVQSPPNAPKPDQFHTDPRVHYDRNVSKWQYEDENGAEYEWAEAAQVWIPIVSQFKYK